MRKDGFTLLELLAGMTLTSLLAFGLIAITQSSTRQVGRLIGRTATSTTMLIAIQHIQRIGRVAESCLKVAGEETLQCDVNAQRIRFRRENTTLLYETWDTVSLTWKNSLGYEGISEFRVCDDESILPGNACDELFRDNLNVARLNYYAERNSFFRFQLTANKKMQGAFYVRNANPINERIVYAW